MEWISVKDRMPADCKPVLMCVSREAREKDRSCGIFVGNFHDIGSKFFAVECIYGDGWIPFDVEDITHWMPLPEMPNDSRV